jgi:hypothetical protein
MNKKINYTNEPKDGLELPEEGFEVISSAKATKLCKSLAIEEADYQQRTTARTIQLKPKRGGSRPGAGRKPTGHVRLQLSVSVASRKKIEEIAKLRNLTLSQAVEELAARA